MTKKIRFKLWILPLMAILAFIATYVWTQQQCTEYTGNFTEDFSTLTYKDHAWCSVRNWTPAPITLNYLGANFEVTEPSGMGARIYVCDSGDFDGDGRPDLIGLDITANPDNRLILIRNNYTDINGDGIDDDGIVYLIDETEVYDKGLHLEVGPASITVGDYNSDGLLDFFFYKNKEDSFGYTQFFAVMYINIGTPLDPDFATYDLAPNLDFTSEFMSAGIYCHWAADHLASVDIDGDADVDILVISEDKIFLVRNPGPGNFDLSNFSISELAYDQNTGFTDGSPARGGSTIDAADFDKDGDVDIIGGTVNDYDHLVYYENDGTGNFTYHEIPIPVPECTGPVATVVGDFNNDGWVDIFAANDRWNAGNEARMYFWKNLGLVETSPGVFEPDFQFRCLNNCDPILPDPHDVDMSAMVDYDVDGDIDVVLADANHSGDYYLIRNDLAGVYALNGEARSTNVAGTLDQRQYAITRVQMTSIEQRVEGGSSQGLSVEFYVSNNGQDWELYTTFLENDIRSQTDLPWHTFNHYGARLYWKALLSAEEDPMAEYESASFETPEIYEVSWEYVYVDRREYSRTTVAVTTVDDSGSQKRFVLAGTFYFPGWQGHLRAYNVSSTTPAATSDSILRTVTTSDLSASSGRDVNVDIAGVIIEWDAGELLDARAAGTRTIYTAVPGVSGLGRTDFTTANVATLGPILQDVNNDNAGLIDFVRGEGRYWKLGDINHSQLIVVGPPDGNAGLKGAGYDNFLTANQNRRKVIYVGANDGMIHCFDALTGEEIWGFIPYNLLPKLKNMWAVDVATGERYFSHDVYVDGSPVAEDVYIDADGNGSREWRTVLICGQGPGFGSTIAGGLNYYFALDITDPYDPQPLWEFTEDTMGETWSIPTVGKIVNDGSDTFVAFVGSGYDNDTNNTVGNYFYGVDIETGVAFWDYETVEVNTSGSFPNIQNTIPGSPSSIDVDQDGFTDRVYFADLDGRVYRLDSSDEFIRRNPTSTTWNNALNVIYEDANNYPIITKPESWISPSATASIPHVFFGTGGDDSAPGDTTYSFVALLDTLNNPEVEWFMGDAALLNLDPALDMGDLDVGAKVWSDPVVANSIVYFSTLTLSIEAVDPCVNLEGAGKLYGRFVQSMAGSAVGGSAFRDSTGTLQSLDLASKTRSAVALGDTDRVNGDRKREVYIQEYDSTIQKLEQPVGAVLTIKSWREIYKVIRN
ncbi:MAG: VCBS repeat-containing protein [Candidatus Aminicenantes bacterium]|nr:MAG: VCBS repeat-containing protein [Candidatus Aminicenantes bacterium]